MRPDLTFGEALDATVTGDLVPWLASQTDLLAEDWYRTGSMTDAL